MTHWVTHLTSDYHDILRIFGGGSKSSSLHTFILPTVGGAGGSRGDIYTLILHTDDVLDSYRIILHLQRLRCLHLQRGSCGSGNSGGGSAGNLHAFISYTNRTFKSSSRYCTYLQRHRQRSRQVRCFYLVDLQRR